MGIGLKRGTVRLEEHQAVWEDEARATIAEVIGALDGLNVDARHVGSTAIRSIRAKPIIDIAVGAADPDAVLARNDRLAERGIVFRKEERPGQLLYVMGDFDADTRTHHIHVVRRDSVEWRHYLDFRDYLNANPAAAREYEAVKEALARRFPNDRGAYTDGKGETVARLLRDAENWRAQRRRDGIRDPGDGD